MPYNFKIKSIIYCSVYDHSYSFDSEAELREKVSSNSSTGDNEAETDPEIKLGEKKEYDLIPKNEDGETKIQVHPENLTVWIRRAVEDYFIANPGPRYVLNMFSPSN